MNSFEQTVSELQTVVLRTNSKAADNIRLKEITLVRKTQHSSVLNHQGLCSVIKQWCF